MNPYRLSVVFSAFFVLSACGTDPATEIENELQIELGPELQSELRAELEGEDSASERRWSRPAIALGRGFQEIASGEREFTFAAIRLPNGQAWGRYTIRLTGPDLFFTVDVSCMTVEGNTAWVAGHIVDTNAAFVEIGSVSYFYAIDNGGPGSSEPDIVSTARFNDIEGEDEAFCRDRVLLLDSAPIDGGFVRVR